MFWELTFHSDFYNYVNTFFLREQFRNKVTSFRKIMNNNRMFMYQYEWVEICLVFVTKAHKVNINSTLEWFNGTHRTIINYWRLDSVLNIHFPYNYLILWVVLKVNRVRRLWIIHLIIGDWKKNKNHSVNGFGLWEREYISIYCTK